MGYLRRTSNHPERITLSNPTHSVSMTNPLAIGVETSKIYSGCSLEQEFIKYIHMNPWVVFYLIVKQVDPC